VAHLRDVPAETAPNYATAAIIPVTVLLVVLFGTLLGSVLPLVFSRLGRDPAYMSNPVVTGLVDVFGITIYMHVALWMLPG
jgi:magnesium transporter